MRKTWVGLLLVAVLVSACSGQSSAEQTLVAQRDTLGTQMAFVYETATIGTDRLAMTVEYIETVTDRISIQGTRLAQTLVARGGVAGPIPFSTAQPGSPVTPAPLTTPDAANAPTPELTPTATPQPALYNIVTASEVGENDCAVGQTNTFLTSAERIYVVATAANIAPGMELAARWYREDEEVARYTLTPDFAIHQACIWFFIDQTDATFTPGNWHVLLDINGEPATIAVPFTLGES